MIQTTRSTVVYQNDWMVVQEDETILPDGQPGKYTFTVRPTGVVGILLNPKNEILLIKQFRYPIQQEQWNLPGGGMDANETPEQAVQREVREEVGVEVDSFQFVGKLHPLSSCSTEEEYLFFARIPDIKEFADGERDEHFLEHRFVPLSEALEMIDSGEITDATTAHAIQLAARKLTDQ